MLEGLQDGLKKNEAQENEDLKNINQSFRKKAIQIILAVWRKRKEIRSWKSRMLFRQRNLVNLRNMKNKSYLLCGSSLDG